MRELHLALRERMFYVRLRTMTKNRVVTVFDRYPEQAEQLKKSTDLVGKTGRQQHAAIDVSEIERVQIDRGLEFIGDINERIKQSEATIRAMTKNNGKVKLLKTIPGIWEFFARLIDAEIDDISRFRNPKKLAAYAGLVPSTAGRQRPRPASEENLADRRKCRFQHNRAEGISILRLEFCHWRRTMPLSVKCRIAIVALFSCATAGWQTAPATKGGRLQLYQVLRSAGRAACVAGM